jgi:hypothetical protein
MHSVSYRRKSYSKEPYVCVHCERNTHFNRQCKSCKAHVCNDVSCALSFDFFLGMDVCEDCIAEVARFEDRVICVEKRLGRRFHGPVRVSSYVATVS